MVCFTIRGIIEFDYRTYKSETWFTKIFLKNLIKFGTWIHKCTHKHVSKSNKVLLVDYIS